MSLDPAASPPQAASRPHALVAGATGLVGRECVRLLLADPAVGRVRALVRRPVPMAELAGADAPAGRVAVKLAAEVVDFEHLDRHAAQCRADWVFCALGTTLRQAGSQAAFRRVDFDYPLKLAQLARQQGARHFLLVSALGADPASSVFYSRVKGELEEAVKALGFERLTLARPSLLAGDRAEFRLGESVARRLAFLTPPRYKPVHVRQVARALVAAAHAGRPGLQVLSNPVLRGHGASPVAIPP